LSCPKHLSSLVVVDLTICAAIMDCLVGDWY
jgi:hypothetical protein